MSQWHKAGNYNKGRLEYNTQGRFLPSKTRGGAKSKSSPSYHARVNHPVAHRAAVGGAMGGLYGAAFAASHHHHTAGIVAGAAGGAAVGGAAGAAAGKYSAVSKRGFAHRQRELNSQYKGKRAPYKLGIGRKRGPLKGKKAGQTYMSKPTWSGH